MLRYIGLVLLPLHVWADLILAAVPWRSFEALEHLYQPLREIILRSIVASIWLLRIKLQRQAMCILF